MRFSGYSVYLNGATAVNHVTDLRCNPGNNPLDLIPAGAVDRKAVPNSFADPMVDFSTVDLTTMLALNTAAYATAGVLLADDVSLFQFQKRASGGLFQSSGNHTTYSALAGFCYPVSLSCGTDSRTGAVLANRFIPLSTEDADETSGLGEPGLSRPLKATSFAASLTGTPGFNSIFFLGPVYIGSTRINCVTNIQIDFGLNVTQLRCETPFTKLGNCSISTRAPVITITTTDAAAVNNLAGDSLHGSALGATLTVYLHKGVHGGTRVAISSGSHVSLAAASGDVTFSEGGFSGNDDASFQLVVRPTAALTVSTTATIPAVS